jgi:uncharacterized membrane protein
MSNSIQHVGGSSVSKTKKLVGMAILAAIVVVLQIVAYAVKVGPVSITLVLIPIVVGAAVYGVNAGAFLGGVFGVVVTIACITNTDIGGAILWYSSPILTTLLCLVKGIAAGWIAGLVYRVIVNKSKKTFLGVILAAIVAPVINTGIFIMAMVLLYHDTLVAWAGGTSIAYFALVGLAGWNFVLELGLNIVLGPIAVRIIKAGKSV